MFKAEAALKSHESEHANEIPFSCSHCNKKFRVEIALKSHESEHSSEKQFSCSQCNKSFETEAILKSHETQDHSSEKQFSCSKCDEKFEAEADLKSHETKDHSSEKQFSCSKCNETFEAEAALKSHETCEHPSEKPFICDKCGETSNGDKKEVIIESEEELATTFNTFFPNKVEKIEKDIPVYDIDPASKLKEKMKGRNLNFKFTHVSEIEVKNAIKSIKSKTSSGVDFVSTKLLKLATDVIALPLTWIINSSFQSGVFPTSWKISKCIPLFKNKGKRTDKTKYRPVSLLKAVSKVIEKIANKKLLQFFESNKLFPQSQHGFRNRRSTFSAVSTMHELWIKGKEQKCHQAVAFLDLSAAFDTLSKKVVCQKLSAYGFNNTSVKWVDSYLSDRSQQVMIGSTLSKPTKLNVGSPQGSILSPTIFIILLSDIELWCPGANLCGYADDTTVTVASKNTTTLKENCEEKVKELLTYMAINKLSANDDKTKVLVIKHGKVDNQLSFKFGDAEIQESTDEKLLGVWVSNDLNWSEHIGKLEDDLSFRLYTLRKLEQSVPKSLLKKVADGIFNSLLRYGLGIFCPIRTKEADPIPSSINGIRVQFNNLLRLLCNSKRNQHTSINSMLKKLGWLSVNQMACEVRLIETWKALHVEDYCLRDIFEKVQATRDTRSANKVRLKTSFKTRIREASFQLPSVELWNNAPPEITEAKTESQAKAAIRKFVKQSIPI